MKTLTPAEMLAWRSFLEAHARVMRILDEELVAGHELPLNWYDVLIQLSEADDCGLRMQDLADRVLLSRSGLTRLIDRMEKAGLVSRQPCEDDKRGLYCMLTKKGEARRDSAAATHRAGVRTHYLQHLTSDQIGAIGQGLHAIATHALDDQPTQKD